MIHTREEGEPVCTGFNFYPRTSNQFGFVFKLRDFVLFVRYNKLQRLFKIHRNRI
jgi:hypothetical protein